MTQPIDFTKPIEHVDGTPLRLSPSSQDRPNPDLDGDWYLMREDGLDFTGQQIPIEGESDCLIVGNNGAHWLDRTSPTLVRNRQPKPSRIPDDVVERMVAFFRKFGGLDSDYTLGALSDECHEIFQLLPAEPVDPDLAEAKAMRMARGMSPHYEKVILAALKRGRELAANEKGEG